MKRLPGILACAAVAIVAASELSSASGLSVEPVLLSLEAPNVASFLTLRNNNDLAVAVQTRVFRWAQRDGEEDMQATSDVAVSPPITTIPPGEDYTVRVVRVAATPVHGEEAYRLWIDELPDSRRHGHAGLTIVVRQSIPLFFRAQEISPSSLAWSARKAGSELKVEARNSGDEHVRVVALHLRDGTGKSLSFGSGLIGYVLGHSAMTFTVPHPPSGFGADGKISIFAQGNTGKLGAIVSLKAAP